MSGYLIIGSLQRSRSFWGYTWKRLLRLYPAYIVLLMLTMLFIPFIYQGNRIFTEPTYWSYLPNALSLYKIQYDVNGVFENNPYPKAINGSLWSLAYEFTMYIILLLLFPFRKFKYLYFILLIMFLISSYCTMTKSYFLGNTMKKIFLQPAEFYKLCTYFMAGSLLGLINLEKINFLWVRWLAFVFLVWSLYLNWYIYISFLFLPILIIFTGISSSRYINNIGKKIGDISYGVYIYAFLVQQTLMYYFKLGTIQLMILSIAITYILAYVSWHLIEKKMLTYKNLLR
jgi:peptidoglycan/LPS O-acetylase OafA/YrhL